MTTINDILKEHVTLDIECIDRLYLNGYIPQMQTGGQLVRFLQQRGPAPARSSSGFGRCPAVPPFSSPEAYLNTFTDGHQGRVQSSRWVINSSSKLGGATAVTRTRYILERGKKPQLLF